jgi:hypothetical protein
VFSYLSFWRQRERFFNGPMSRTLPLNLFPWWIQTPPDRGSERHHVETVTLGMPTAARAIRRRFGGRLNMSIRRVLVVPNESRSPLAADGSDSSVSGLRAMVATSEALLL